LLVTIQELEERGLCSILLYKNREEKGRTKGNTGASLTKKQGGRKKVRARTTKKQKGTSADVVITGKKVNLGRLLMGRSQVYEERKSGQMGGKRPQ